MPDDRTPASLPDLSRRPRSVAASRPVVLETDDQEKGRSRVVIATVVTVAVVLIAAVALIVSQLGIDPDKPTPAPTLASDTATAPSSPQGSEYVPDGEQPSVAPPPPVFTEQPSVACKVLDQASESQMSAPSGTVRGGALQYTRPKGWDFEWGYGDQSFMTDVAGYGRHVEGNWYSVVSLGRVTWPKSEGQYPGAEKAANAIFQCYATSAGLIETFGDKPKVTDYRTEPTTVDGKAAWIVQGTYHFKSSSLTTTSASVVTCIVVDTPGGPSALISDVAADHPEHVKQLDQIISSLKVVG